MSVLDATAPIVVATFEEDLRAVGLESLVDWATGWFAANQDADDATFILELEKQQAYRDRFAAVFDRRERAARGEKVAPLTAAQQLDFERQARELESMYGLPPEFIDAREALGGDVSINELYARAALAASDAQEAFNSVQGRAVIEELLGQPGVTAGGIVGFFLDPDKMLPELQRATDAAQVAAAAGRSAFTLTTEESLALSEAGFDPGEIQQRAAVVTTAGDVRFGVGGRFGALSREEELGLLAGDVQAMQDLERRRQLLQADFAGGGRFLRSNTGAAVGLGSA